MSSQSAQEKAAGDTAAWQANLAQQLSGITLPELQQMIGGTSLTGYSMNAGGKFRPTSTTTKGRLGDLLAGRDASGKMAPDVANYQGSLSELDKAYGNARFSGREAITYGAQRAGEGLRSPAATQSAITSAATSLERDQMAAQRNLEFMSAQASMQDYNKVLQLLGQGSNTALGLAGGFAGTSASAIAGMNKQSQLGSTLGGAATGASLGSAAGPWGALIGGVVGGGAGYLTSS